MKAEDTLISNRGYSFWILVFIFQISMVLLFSLEYWIPLIFLFTLILMGYSPYNLTPAIYLLIMSLFIGFYIIEKPIGIRIVDVIISVSVITYILHKAFRGDLSIMKTSLNKPIIIFLIGITISLFGAPQIGNGVINLLRHLELFAIFYIITDITFLEGKAIIRKMLDYYVYIATGASAVAITMLYSLGGGRAFGVTGSPLSDLIVSALIITISQIYLRQSSTQRGKYSLIAYILFVQIIMTQTRGAWLSLIIATLFLTLLLKKASIPLIIKHTFWVSILFCLAIITSSTIFSNSFIGMVHRVEHLQQLNIGTLHYRLILWDAGINAFLSHFVNGIGLGHFPILSGDYSSIGNSSFFIDNIKGLSTHNIILSYLAETGIIGTFCLLLLFMKIIQVGHSIYESSENREDYQLSIPLYCILFYVCISSFYAGAWFWSISGVQFMFFLSLATVFRKIMKHENSHYNNHFPN